MDPLLQTLLRLLKRLFEELDRKIISHTTASQANQLNRYSPEGVNNALRLPHHWNGSFELTPTQIRGRALLLHGLTDSPYSLRNVAQILSHNGFYVLGLRKQMNRLKNANRLSAFPPTLPCPFLRMIRFTVTAGRPNRLTS